MIFIGVIEIRKITRETVIYSLIGAALCEVISLVLIGFSFVFLYGLVLGLAVAVVGLHMLAANIKTATGARRTKSASSGFIIRILLYALALCLCARTGQQALIGCIVGLLLPKAALTFGQLAMPKIREAMGKEEPVTEHFVVVPNPRSRLFVRSQGMTVNKGGRDYITYSHFKEYRLEEVNTDKSAESKR